MAEWYGPSYMADCALLRQMRARGLRTPPLFAYRERPEIDRLAAGGGLETIEMQNQNPVLEDLSRLMSSIAGTMAGAGREAEAKMKERFREAIGGADFVSREEFEAVKAMAAETKAELEALKAQLAAGLKPAGGGAAARPKKAATPKSQTIDIN